VAIGCRENAISRTRGPPSLASGAWGKTRGKAKGRLRRPLALVVVGLVAGTGFEPVTSGL